MAMVDIEARPGNGAADFTIVLNGDHTDFTNFVL